MCVDEYQLRSKKFLGSVHQELRVQQTPYKYMLYNELFIPIAFTQNYGDGKFIIILSFKGPYLSYVYQLSLLIRGVGNNFI